MKILIGIALFVLFVVGIRYAMIDGVQAPAVGGGIPVTAVSWRPVRIGDEAVPEDSGLFIQFDVDGSIKGHGGCNRFFGTLQQTDSGIEVGPLGSTRMACPEPVMNRETAFLDAVQKTTGFQTGENSMSLVDEDGGVLASFIADFAP